MFRDRTSLGAKEVQRLVYSADLGLQRLLLTQGTQDL